MPPEQSPQDQYQFILNPQQQASPSKFNLSGAPKTRLLLIAGGIFVTLIVLFIGISLFGGSSDNKEQLTSIVQEQNEIVRVAGLATGKARSQTALNLSVSTAASVSSSQQRLTALITKKAKLNPKIVAKKQNAQTDALLTTAAQNNQFDDTFIKILLADLLDYQKNLKAAYDKTSNKATKQVLQDAYSGTAILLNSSNAATTAPN